MYELMIFIYLIGGIYTCGKSGPGPRGPDGDPAIPQVIVYILVFLTWPYVLGRME